MSEERSGGSKIRTEAAVKSLRQILERAWPVDRKPVFGSLVKAIDEFDRDQRRRRKNRKAADPSD